MNICHIQLHFSKEFHSENIICKIQLKLNSFIANLAYDSIYYRQLATCNDSQRRFTAFSHCAIDKFMCAHCWHYIYIYRIYCIYSLYICISAHIFHCVWCGDCTHTDLSMLLSEFSPPLSLSHTFFLISIYGLAFVA